MLELQPPSADRNEGSDECLDLCERYWVPVVSKSDGGLGVSLTDHMPAELLLSS